MRVVHVETGRHLYGGARQVAWLAKGLAGHGVENFLVCPPGSEIATETANGSVQIVEIPMHGDLDVGLVRRLIRFSWTRPGPALAEERGHADHGKERAAGDPAQAGPERALGLDLQRTPP